MLHVEPQGSEQVEQLGVVELGGIAGLEPVRSSDLQAGRRLRIHRMAPRKCRPARKLSGVLSNRKASPRHSLIRLTHRSTVLRCL
jgi:hypothetical protein